MSTHIKDISEMNFEELRHTVADMRAELTKYKRLINMISEDIENSSFGRSILLQNGKLATEIKVLAGKVESAVTDEDMESVITHTANEVAMKVGRGFDVSDAEATTTIPTADGDFDTKTIYKYTETVTDDDGTGREVVTYYFYDETLERWCPIEGDSIYSVFEQTATGFKLKGNVVIDGNTVVTENLKLSGNVTWDMSNSPVKSQYSADGVSNWADEFDADIHYFMRMSFDGGKTWSNATKVVGTDGAPGESGGEASVTAQAMFDALTNEGNLQGIFPAFVVGEDGNGKTQIYINSEYLATRIAEVAESLYIGDITTTDTLKMIKFNGTANINTGCDGGTGLEFNASRFEFWNGILDLSKVVDIEWGEHAPTALAVFGE